MKVLSGGEHAAITLMFRIPFSFNLLPPREVALQPHGAGLVGLATSSRSLSASSFSAGVLTVSFSSNTFSGGKASE